MMGILSADQIKNYHYVLSIARARLYDLYAGKIMNLFPAESNNSQQYEVIDFNIVPVERGGTKLPQANTVEKILSTEDITDLTIMLSYADNTGAQNLLELQTFLSANNITDL